MNAVDPKSVFRAERTLKAGEISGVVIPVPSTDAYSPYAEKWKEFDKLNKLAKEGNQFQWVHWMWSVILPGIGLLNRHHVSKKHDLWLFAFGVLLGLVGLVRAQLAKERFAHWPCPRCGAEWPGTKTEKEPKCTICGLNLHQLAP
jgi:hypothetical protein